MSHGNIRRIARSCVSYRPGHQVHWIHAKKAHEPQPEITVVVTVHYDGRVDLDGDDLHLSLWNHGPAWLQSVLDQAGHHGLWKPRFHALFAPRYGGRIFNLAALDHLRPCVADDDHSPANTAETALERAVWHARERGGYTRCGWTACALPAVQPTTVTGFSDRKSHPCCTPRRCLSPDGSRC